MSQSVTVVLAHGRAAELEIAATMSRLWADALVQGLDRVGSPHASTVRVEYAFFGGLWRPDAAKPMPLFRDGAGRAYAVALSPSPHVEEVPEAEAGQALPGLATGAKVLAQLAPEFALERLLRQAIPDVFDYLDEPKMRRLANGIVTDTCVENRAAVLVGFSMGTVVGYDVLRTAPNGFPVSSFVTCGSPIGMEPIRKRLLENGGTPFPAQAKVWLNIWNEDDVATGIHGSELAKLFPGGVIQSARTWGRGPSPTNMFAAHNAIDYLSSLAMGLALHVAIESALA